MIASFCSTAWRACDVLQESHNLTTRVSSTGPFASAGWDQFVGGTWDAWGCLMGTPKSTPNPSKSHGLSHGLSGNIRLVFFVTSPFTKAKSEPWLCCTRWHKMRPLSIPDVKWSFCTGTVEVCSFCWCLHNWYPVHLSTGVLAFRAQRCLTTVMCLGFSWPFHTFYMCQNNSEHVKKISCRFPFFRFLSVSPDYKLPLALAAPNSCIAWNPHLPYSLDLLVHVDPCGILMYITHHNYAAHMCVIMCLQILLLRLDQVSPEHTASVPASVRSLAWKATSWWKTWLHLRVSIRLVWSW